MTKKILVALVVLTWVFAFDSVDVLASHTSSDPAVIGQLGPFIPMHKDAIHAGIEPRTNKLCFWMRPTEYRGTDLVDPTLGPLGTPASLRPEFADYAYGGFGFSTGPHGLDQSVSTRISKDLSLDNGLCLDLNDPDALANTGRSEFGELTDGDFDLNRPAVSNAGHSAGLNYNVFCSGHVALADGRWLFVGGHMYAGNNGIRKMNIFDPVSQRWADRGMPPVKAAYLADPQGTGPRPDPRVETNSDPPHPSDLKYQRWYPTVVALPDGLVLILSGTDQNVSLGPGTGGPCTSTIDSAACSKVRQVVPEIYDPATDRTIALENARKMFAMYAPAYVVQTGPKTTDYKVAVIAEMRPPAPGISSLGAYDPWTYSGKTYLLDVRAALADPNRNLPGERHWQFVDEALIAHEGGGAGAQLWELDAKGMAVRQRVVLFGGGCGASDCDGKIVEMIDYQARPPRWQRQSDLIQAAVQNSAVVLPTGKVLVMGGLQARAPRCPSPAPSEPIPWIGNSFHYQLFDPDTGRITALVETNHPLHDHSTVALLPSAEVLAMGGNRTDLMNDACDLETGVPAMRVYKPAYFFTGQARPVITKAPDTVSYRQRFVLRVAENSGPIASVAIIRPGPVTHNWDWGNRYVKLWFEHKDGKVVVQAPALPGLAVPGYYMLFIVNQAGVPSVAKTIHLTPDEIE